MGGYTTGVNRIRLLSAKELGLESFSQNGSKTSSWFSTDDMNILVLHMDHTNSTATAMTFYFQETYDEGTTIARMQASAISSGTETLDDHVVSKALSGDATFNYKINVSAPWMRIVFPAATAAGAGDLLVVTGELRNQN